MPHSRSFFTVRGDRNRMHGVEKHKFDNSKFKQDTFSTDIQYSYHLVTLWLWFLWPIFLECCPYTYQNQLYLPWILLYSTELKTCNRRDCATSWWFVDTEPRHEPLILFWKLLTSNRYLEFVLLGQILKASEHYTTWVKYFEYSYLKV